MKPGIHDLNAARYYSDDLGDEPSLNASTAKLLLNQSPRHAWQQHPKLNPRYQESHDRKYDVGSVVHEVFLLNNTDKVAVAEFSDWRKKDAQEFRDQARADGKIPLLAREWDAVEEMLIALREQVAGHQAQPTLFSNGKPEQTIVWRENGVLCRCRIDWLHDDHSTIDDLKTSKWTASPQAWGRRTLWSIGADVQAAFYTRAVKAITDTEPDFRLVIIECDPPYALSAVTLSPAALVLANAKVDAAIETWKRCLADNTWPAYVPHVIEVEAPAWAEMDFWDQQQIEDAA